MFQAGAQRLTRNIFQSFTFLEWLHLGAITTVCVIVSWFTGRVLGWPVFLRDEASVLASRAPGAGIAAVVAALAVCVPLGSLLLGRLRHDAGLFVAAVGLAALSARGGPVSAALRSVASPRLYATAAMETIMLLGMMGLAWQWLVVMARIGWAIPEPPPTAEGEELESGLATQVMAALVQATVTGLLILLLAQTDAKKQVMAAVAVASLLGGIAAHQSFPVSPSVPFWVGPLLTGLVGYVWAMRSPGRWAIGMPANPLAAASPLDYASLGTAGAILGYWVSRVWKQEPPELEIPEDAIE